MGFCPNCGASVDSPVCQKCGASQALEPIFTRGKIMGPVAWLIVALLGLGLIAGVGLLALGITIIRNVIGANEPASARNDPSVQALARYLISTHPEIEVVSIDHQSNLVTVRERKTGKILSEDLTAASLGVFPFQNAVASTTHFAPEVHLAVPDWIPAYPFSEPRAAALEPNRGTFRFRTTDSVFDVLAFYQEALKRFGFQITATTTRGHPRSLEGTLTATDAHFGRNILLMVSAIPAGAAVTLTFAADKKRAN